MMPGVKYSDSRTKLLFVVESRLFFDELDNIDNNHQVPGTLERGRAWAGSPREWQVDYRNRGFALCGGLGVLTGTAWVEALRVRL